jgi:hypothetical protein
MLHLCCTHDLNYGFGKSKIQNGQDQSEKMN